MLHEICVSKTGTLTTGKMRVAKYAIGNDTVSRFHHEGMDSVKELDHVDPSVLEKAM